MNNLIETKIDWIGVGLISIFFVLLSYAGYLSYKSIDWKVLENMESQKLILPTPATLQPQAIVQTPQPATPTVTKAR